MSITYRTGWLTSKCAEGRFTRGFPYSSKETADVDQRIEPAATYSPDKNATIDLPKTSRVVVQNDSLVEEAAS